MSTFPLIPETPQVIIVDDFYPSLDWLFPHLETHELRQTGSVNYAGMTFPAPEKETAFALKKIEQVLGCPLEVTGLQGDLRVTLKQHAQDYKSFVHADYCYNVIVYLSGEENDEGGTAFYRHRDLDMHVMHKSEPRAAQMQVLLPFDTNDLSRWEFVMRVPFKRNRAVMFNGHYFHSVPPTFYGSSVREGRITQNFFYYSLADRFAGR